MIRDDEFRFAPRLRDLHRWIITKVLAKHLRILGLLFVVGFLVKDKRFQPPGIKPG